jgi:exopolysaccharide production protein ExoZ
MAQELTLESFRRESVRAHAGSSVLANVQVLRAIAAFSVVFVHLDVVLRTLHLRTFGAGGVDIFFVISGYLMVYTTRSRRPGATVFFANRVARIAPIYWAVTFAVYALAIVAPGLLQATRADPVQLVKSLTFIPFAKANGLVEPVLFVGWTLNYEMFFYVLLAVGLLVHRYDVGMAITAAILGLLVVSGCIWEPQGVVVKFFTSPIMLEFAMGMALAFVIPMAPAGAPGAARGAVATLGLCALVWTIVWSGRMQGVLRVVGVGLPAAVVLSSALLIEKWGWRASSPLLIGLGDVSYAIYLTHPFVTQTAQKLVRVVKPHAAGTVLCMAATLLAIGVVGWVVHRTFELPLTRMARKGLRVASASR